MPLFSFHFFNKEVAHFQSYCHPRFHLHCCWAHQAMKLQIVVAVGLNVRHCLKQSRMVHQDWSFGNISPIWLKQEVVCPEMADGEC